MGLVSGAALVLDEDWLALSSLEGLGWQAASKTASVITLNFVRIDNPFSIINHLFAIEIILFCKN